MEGSTSCIAQKTPAAPSKSVGTPRAWASRRAATASTSPGARRPCCIQTPMRSGRTSGRAASRIRGLYSPRIALTSSPTHSGIATCRDLIHWTKHGPVFARAADGKYLRVESKSGAILSRVEGDRIIATRVNGKYWMYFGVPALLIATSDNLLDWTPVEGPDGHAVKVLSPRPEYFDSWLVEGGPPALLTTYGVLVMYNAESLPSRTYSAGQALFDAHEPTKLIARSDSAFIKPTERYERTGQYAAGTTFVEGLVPFRGRWYLYYGTADSRVGVAVWDPQGQTCRK